jgi:hypothetical protein
MTERLLDAGRAGLALLRAGLVVALAGCHGSTDTPPAADAEPWDTSIDTQRPLPDGSGDCADAARTCFDCTCDCADGTARNYGGCLGSCDPVEPGLADCSLDCEPWCADTSATNACGGHVALRFDGGVARPGDACGDCTDGALVCDGLNRLRCEGASTPNACGRCTPLPGEPGTPCGDCGLGRIACAAGGTTTVCIGDPGANLCGGCADLAARPGDPCLVDGSGEGLLGCDGPDGLACQRLDRNACGGETPLEAEPGGPCGSCGAGTWTCSGRERVRCANADAGQNACGGCTPLPVEIGEVCGACDTRWSCDGADGFVCPPVRWNACGGCRALPAPLGEACDGSGVVACAGTDRTACAPAGSNVCGGNAPLAQPPGESCGACGDGRTLCIASSATRCEGATAMNPCGGCGPLAEQPGGACPGGTLVCDGPDSVACAPASSNPCGGTAPLTGAPGSPCGACDSGRLACDGPDLVRCVDARTAPLGWWLDVDRDGWGMGRQLEAVGGCAPPAIDLRVKCDLEQQGCYNRAGLYGFCSMLPLDTGVCVLQGAPCSANADCEPPFVCIDGPLVAATGAAPTGLSRPSPFHFIPGGGVHACMLPDTDAGFDWAPNGLDCDDLDPAVGPNQPERCNGSDDDCDGSIDEDFDLLSDLHCGACFRTCAPGTSCLEGACR